MTRIIAGRAGGRSLQVPKGRDTRPTTDRVREALFSRVQSLLDLDEARVLDLYAGSGALGLEALSRGAGHLTAVERHRPTARLVERNARDLGLAAQVEVLAGGVEAVLARGPGHDEGRGPARDEGHGPVHDEGRGPGQETEASGTAYHLVLLDPPYPVGETELAAVLSALVEHGWLTEDALVVVERSARSPEPTWPPGLTHLDTRRYGETAVHYAEVPGA